MANCPVCSNELLSDDIVCPACIDKIALNEPKRRENRIGQAANTMVVFLAIFLIFKGAFAMWEQGGYKEFVASLGFPTGSEGLHYLNATVCVVAALGYAVTALGNYLSKAWTMRLCGITLAFLLVGEAVVQFGDIHEGYGFFKALSALCFIAVVPVLQYVMSVQAIGASMEQRG